MALIVEDGSMVAGAESYATTAQADTYFSNIGTTPWAALTTAEKEQALRRSTNYMKQTFRSRWNGYRKTATQALDWPRTECPRPDELYGESTEAWIEDTVVPVEVREACIELAYRAASGNLLEDLGRAVASESVSGAVAVSYVNGGSRQTTYEAVNRLLAPLLKASGGIPMARA